jgi:hypothetical protein
MSKNVLNFGTRSQSSRQTHMIKKIIDTTIDTCSKYSVQELVLLAQKSQASTILSQLRAMLGIWSKAKITKESSSKALRTSFAST